MQPIYSYFSALQFEGEMLKRELYGLNKATTKRFSE